MPVIETEPASGAAIWPTFRESPVAVKTILCGVLLNRLSGFLNIFLVLYATSRGYSAGQAVFALAAYGGGGIAGSLIGGTLADRLGPRAVTVISMGGTGVLTASLLFLPSYGWLLAAVALVGLTAQMFRPASSTLLSEFTSEHRVVMIFAIYRFSINLGVVAAPLLGYALYNLDHQRYTLLFWGQALIAVSFAVVAWLLLPARTSPAVDETAAMPAGPDSGYLAVLRDRRFVLYLVVTFFHSAVYVQYLSTLPLMVSASGLKIIWYTLAVSLNAFIVIAFELPMTKVTQGWPKKVPIGLGLALVGAGMAVYGLPIAPAIIIIGTLVWSLGEIVSGPTFYSYPAIAGPGRLTSRYIGSFQFMVGLGTVIGPVVGGWLFIQMGHAAWPVLAAGSLIAALCGVAAVRAPASPVAVR
jgi:MFS family permease